MGSSAGVNYFIYVSELCALKSPTLSPLTWGKGQLWCRHSVCLGWRKENGTLSNSMEAERWGGIQQHQPRTSGHHHNAACAGCTCKVKQLCLRALLSPCLGGTAQLWGKWVSTVLIHWQSRGSIQGEFLSFSMLLCFWFLLQENRRYDGIEHTLTMSQWRRQDAAEIWYLHSTSAALSPYAKYEVSSFLN